MNLGALKPKGQTIYVSRYQTAGEIAGAICKAIKDSRASAEILAPHFKAKDKKTTCKLIWVFLKNAVPYKREPGNSQTAKTLPRILSERHNGHDCKHYTIMFASLLKALNIPVKLRLISQNFYDKQPNHIYAVATINGKEVICDSVLKNFDTEARYNYKYDIQL